MTGFIGMHSKKWEMGLIDNKTSRKRMENNNIKMECSGTREIDNIVDRTFALHVVSLGFTAIIPDGLSKQPGVIPGCRAKSKSLSAASVSKKQTNKNNNKSE